MFVFFSLAQMKLIQQQQLHSSMLNGPSQPPEKKFRVSGSFNGVNDSSNFDYQVMEIEINFKICFSLKSIQFSREIQINPSRFIHSNHDFNRFFLCTDVKFSHGDRYQYSRFVLRRIYWCCLVFAFFSLSVLCSI